jgi:hypothetical protein
VLIARINDHLRDLLPRTVAEARSFAAVGRPMLSELPETSRGLSEARAAAMIQAAAIVNGPEALDALARYSGDPRPRVQKQLIAAWDYFDPMDYAERVLADAPLDDGSVLITNPALLPGLSRLRHLNETRVEVRQAVDSRSLRDVPHLTSLTLSEGLIGDIRELGRHAADLRHLKIKLNRRRHDLSVLGELTSLGYLYLTQPSSDQDFPDLRLPKLRSFALHDTAMPDSILPALSQVAHLYLGGAAEPLGGIAKLIRQLSKFPHFEALSVGECDWLTDLSVLTSLRRLRTLLIDATPVTDLSPLVKLADLSWLSIENERHLFDLTPLASLPNLRTLYVGHEVAELDLTPLRAGQVTVHIPKELRAADVAAPPGLRIKRY